jgi:hypothetical protein
MFPDFSSITAFFQKITGAWDAVAGFFNPEFFGLIGLTGLIVGSAMLIAYFFPVLRGVAGAAVVGVAAAWYGYTKGQDSKEKEIAKLKAQAKAKPVPVVPKKEPWQW